MVVGDVIGPYRILGKLGEGGMGQVYRARDTQLKRDVALKVLPEALTTDPDRLARFHREAEVLASLNHPNIAQIYGLERQDGHEGRAPVLVMELVEGATLQEILAGSRRVAGGGRPAGAAGPQPPATGLQPGTGLPIDEAVAIARQIADALEAAHERGVIHRDLKPANIKVRDDGTVKVLDFGLAKLVETAPDNSKLTTENYTASATITTPAMTQQGVLLGTATYMAPEQARGRPVDKRADIWAFGCVLYEMLTGRRAFPGEDVSETLATVIKNEPDWTALPEATSSRLRQVLQACLRKDPKERLHDMADVRLLLAGTFEPPAPAPASTLTASAVSERRFWQRPWGALGAAGLLVVLTAGAILLLSRPAPMPAPVVRFTVPPPPDYELRNSALHTDLAVSPDGRRLVYRVVPRTGSNFGSLPRLYLRTLDQLEGTVLRDTEGANLPFFSADGEWVGFIAENDTVLKKVALSNGAQWSLVSLAAADAFRGASWGSDDRIVYTTNTGDLYRVPSAGGEPELLRIRGSNETEWGPGRFLWPDVLPGSRAVLVTWDPDGGIDDQQVAALDLGTGRQKLLIPRGSHPRYSPTGHVVYATAGTLWAVRFDVDRLEVGGNPVPLVQGVATKISGAANFSLDRHGTLAYAAGPIGNVRARTLAWVDRQGREEVLPAAPDAYDLPRLSPDGTKVALEVERPENTDVYVFNLERNILTRLTTDPARDLSPMWMPDGKMIVFGSTRDGGGIFMKAADGSGQETRFAPAKIAGEPLPHSWSADGRIVFYVGGGPTIGDIFTLAPGAQTAEALLEDPTIFEGHPAMSPDGRWLAYTSNVSGANEIYVVPYPNVRERQIQITQGGAREAAWVPGGRELVYRPMGRLGLEAVPLEADPTLRPGGASLLFESPDYQFPQQGRHYDISGDGQRFLVLKVAASDQDTGLTDPAVTVVLNFFDELRARVP